LSVAVGYILYRMGWQKWAMNYYQR
jgi:hypothetical protein